MLDLPRFLRFPLKNPLRINPNDELSIQKKMDSEDLRFRTALVTGESYSRLKKIGAGTDFLKIWLKNEVEKNVSDMDIKPYK